MERFRAMTLFQPSNFVAAIESSLKNESHLYGSIMAFPHQKVARTVSVLGFDFIMVDALHTAINPENLVALIQTITFTSEGKTCTAVRVPNSDSDLLTYALDAGASGIIFPHIDTAAEARAAVHKVRYACSGGDRSLSPCALLGGITDIAPPGWTAEKIADRNIAIICQIESELAVENAEAIATTPGVHALMIGSGDLRVSLGLPSRTPPGCDEDPRFYAAIAKVKEVAKKHKKSLMIVAFKANADKADWLKDFNLILTSADIVSVAKCHREELAKMKDALSTADKGTDRNGNHCNGYKEGVSASAEILSMKNGSSDRTDVARLVLQANSD